MPFRDAVSENGPLSFLDGGGATGALVRGFDWSATPIGAPQGWPQPLKTLVGVMLDADQPMFIAWGPGRTLLYNDAYAPMLAARHPSALGQPFLKVWSEVEDELAPLFAQVFSGTPVHMSDLELTLMRAGTPEEAHFAFGYTPVRDEGGMIAGLFCVCTETTGEVLAERERIAQTERLRASEEFNRRVLASSADCIKVLDLDARLEFLSEGGMRAMEVEDFGAVAGKYWPDLWQGERYADAVAAVEQARLGGTGRFQGLSPTLKGTMRWWDVIVTQIAGADGRPEKLLSISRDVTATKTAEEALRNLNATLEERVAMRTSERNMLASILESTDIMVMACDLDHRIVAINQASADEYERVYGVRPAAGDTLDGVLHGQPEHLEQVLAVWRQGEAADELTLIREFGDPARRRPCYEIKFRALVNDHGQRVGTYQFVTDITERMREQAQLAEAQEALRQSQKLEAMGQLTGGVSHDFNNLLTPIIGSLDLLQRRSLGGEREQRLIGGALQAAERAKTLVQRLLAFARRQPLQAEAVDVAMLVDGMRDLVASTVGPRVNVQIDAAAGLPAARADANQLEMALLNLAVNARDAMPGVGTLTISAQLDEIDESHRAKLAPGSYVRLSVVDDGTGMDEATLARAIEPFFSTKGVGKGTGLGLSMVHGLAAQLGGGLAIASTVGAGTRIDLWLPATAEVAALTDEVRSAPESSVVGTVLLIDDEDLVRTSTADMLSELGYEVVEAGSAEEGLQLLDGGLAVDLLVTDHLMPGMTGTELALMLKDRSPTVPVLIISGYAETRGIAVDLPRLTKPFRHVDLAASVAALVGPDT